MKHENLFFTSYLKYNLQCFYSFVISFFLGEPSANRERGSQLHIIEADEYDGAFLGLSPAFTIITNIEFDHPDIFKSMRDVRNSLLRFVRRTKRG